MFTLYRSKGPTGGFRAVAGQHTALDANHYTRHDFATAREALEGCKTDDERKVVLLVDPLADRNPGTWVRIDKGDGEVSNVSADEVFEKCHAAKVCRTGAELRRRIAQAENGLNVTLQTDFARYEYRQGS